MRILSLRRCHPTRFIALAALTVVAAACARERPPGGGSIVAARTLGLAYLQTDQLPEAEAQFKQVVALAPNEALGHTNLGLTYLRGGRLSEAEASALRAAALDSTAPNIALLLAGVYAAQGRTEDARGVLEPRVRAGADDPALLFALAHFDTGAARAAERADLLRRILAKAPTNLAVRFAQLDGFVTSGAADSATRSLEEIRRLPPEPPREALDNYILALRHVRAGRLAEAGPALTTFRRAMELTPAFQASLASVKGPDGPMVGRPALVFSPRLDIAQRMGSIGKFIADAVQFTDVTQEMGLAAAPTGAAPGAAASAPSIAALAVGDVDGDGKPELLVAGGAGGSVRGEVHLYREVRGVYEDFARAARLSLPNGAAWATFADYDNDGYLDLFALAPDGGARLLRNTGKSRFDDATRDARLGDVRDARRAAFVDLDHDGDLDLAVTGPQGLRAFRNNADGTFSDETAAFGLTLAGEAHDIAFADFDGDGRTDLVVSRGAAGLTLFRNAGARRFEDSTAVAGLGGTPGAQRPDAGAIAVGDVDNDGAFDLLTTPAGGGAPALWHNRGDGTFARATRAEASLAPLARLNVHTLRFDEYDNDGWLDVIAAGTPLALAGTTATAQSGGLALFRNDGTGRFVDRTALLPGDVLPVLAMATVDLATDGDEDLVIAEASGRVRLIGNVGGNANLHVQVRLAALRTGSGKNNTFGIGSKVELRVGDMVQTRVVTSPVTHLGLGAHLKADVLRVEWTNGVPQVVYFPGSDQDVLENEVLKSSCGFLYAWNGERFAFVTDVMWRSALGMPMGIMGANTSWAPPGASQEYLRIPGSALAPRNGEYVLQLTEELWETSYTDEVQLLAVDHPDSVSIHVDERFVPPGPISLRMFKAARAHPPLSAVDERGNDVRAALLRNDDVYVSDLVASEFQGIVASHDVVMDLGPEAGAPGTHLYLRGWIYPTDASINVSLSQQSRIKPVMPVLEVRDAAGRWSAAADIGFPSGKDKTVVVDLAGKFPTRDHHVRIRTNMQIYWDQAFVAAEAPESPARVTPLRMKSADLHFRGTSRMYRKGGRYGPWWFDYEDVTRDPVWRPITGAFTRFGDVLPLLGTADDMYVVMAPGDEATLRFEALPPPPAGWTRDFLLYSDGWIKDADMNTALGDRSGPLPFHAIKAYPYGPGDRYPNDAEHRRYLREYNTRTQQRVGSRP